MIKINLLPWREERKLIAIYRYSAALVITVVATLLLIYILNIIFISYSQTYSSSDKTKLSNNITEAEKKIKELKIFEEQYNELKKFTGIINKMQLSPVILLEALKEIPGQIPDTVRVNVAFYKESIFTLKGQAISQKETFKFMENLKTLDFIKNVDLQDFNKSINSAATFTLKIIVIEDRKM